MIPCPLCNHQAQFFLQDKKRAFYVCPHCGLVMADPKSHIRPSIEIQRYGRAQKGTKQRQLSQFLMPLLAQINLQQSGTLSGLNFGRVLDAQCLQSINEAGHSVKQYDPFFAADHSVLQTTYDFVCSYKVFEHFRHPNKEWQLLSRLVKPGGWLAISTPLMTDLRHFNKWHYKNNPTHVSFYQRQTFEYLTENSEFTLLFVSQALILMQKSSGSGIKRILI
jgi:SAM-dependent methyltransferase